MSNLRYCKRCRKYDDILNFYTWNTNGYIKHQHKNKLCRKANTKALLWDDYLNPKVIKEIEYWYSKNEEQIKAYNRIHGRVMIQKLSDGYVRSILIDCGYTYDQLNKYPEIVKTKREIIKTNRLCKTSQN